MIKHVFLKSASSIHRCSQMIVISRLLFFFGAHVYEKRNKIMWEVDLVFRNNLFRELHWYTVICMYSYVKRSTYLIIRLQRGWNFVPFVVSVQCINLYKNSIWQFFIEFMSYIDDMFRKCIDPSNIENWGIVPCKTQRTVQFKRKMK